MIRRLSHGMVASTVLALSAVFGGTNAVAAVTIQSVDANYLPSVAELVNPAPSAGVAPLHTPPPVSKSGEYRSPFEQVNQAITPGYETAQFRYVPGTGNANNSATYNYSTGTNTFALLWGSPDSYNTLKFFDGVNGTGALMGSFTLSSLTSFATPTGTVTGGLGHAYVTFLAGLGELIKSVVLASTTAAFEFAHVNTGPGGANSDTPLPPALILFGSALVGLTLLGRRRRRATASGPATA